MKNNMNLAIAKNIIYIYIIMGKDLIKILKTNIHWILLILFIIVIVIVINNQYKNKESFRISAKEGEGIENMTRERFFERLKQMNQNASDVNIVINGKNITDVILNLVRNIIDNKNKITEKKYQDILNKYIESLECNEAMWRAVAQMKGNMDGFSIGGPNDGRLGDVVGAAGVGVGDLTSEQQRQLFGLIGAVGIGLVGGALLISQGAPTAVGILALFTLGAFEHGRQLEADDVADDVTDDGAADVP